MKRNITESIKKTKRTAVLVFLAYILVSSMSAYCSIIGMSELFAGAAFSIMFITAFFEFGKNILLYTVHAYWGSMRWIIKLPSLIIILALLSVSATGIFGFLSKSHQTQEAPIVEEATQLKAIDSRIDMIEQTIQLYKDKLSNTDVSAGSNQDNLKNEIYAKIENDRLKIMDLKEERDTEEDEAKKKRVQDKITAMGRMIETNKKRVRELGSSSKTAVQNTDKIYAQIDKETEKLITLKKERVPLATKVNTFELTLGPVKYVADLFRFDLSDDSAKMRAIQIIILFIMLAFDPLSIILMFILSDLMKRVDEEEDDEPTDPKPKKKLGKIGKFIKKIQDKRKVEEPVEEKTNVGVVTESHIPLTKEYVDGHKEVKSLSFDGKESDVVMEPIIQRDEVVEVKIPVKPKREVIFGTETTKEIKETGTPEKTYYDMKGKEVTGDGKRIMEDGETTNKVPTVNPNRKEVPKQSVIGGKQPVKDDILDDVKDIKLADDMATIVPKTYTEEEMQEILKEQKETIKQDTFDVIDGLTAIKKEEVKIPFAGNDNPTFQELVSELEKNPKLLEDPFIKLKVNKNPELASRIKKYLETKSNPNSKRVKI